MNILFIIAHKKTYYISDREMSDILKSKDVERSQNLTLIRNVFDEYKNMVANDSSPTLERYVWHIKSLKKYYNNVQYDLEIDDDLAKKERDYYMSKCVMKTMMYREHIPAIYVYNTNTFNNYSKFPSSSWILLNISDDIAHNFKPIVLEVGKTTNNVPEHIIVENHLVIRVDTTDDVSDGVMRIASQDSDCLLISYEMLAKDINFVETLKRNRWRFRYILILTDFYDGEFSDDVSKRCDKFANYLEK